MQFSFNKNIFESNYSFYRLRNRFYYRSQNYLEKVLNIEATQNREHKLSLRICRNAKHEQQQQQQQ